MFLVKGVTKGPDCQTVPDELSKIVQGLNEEQGGCYHERESEGLQHPRVSILQDGKGVPFAKRSAVYGL